MHPSAVAEVDPPPDRSPATSLAWRSDIEGLRGVAVLLVVLFHAGIGPFAGGYVGVDVFFALSGYLITGILVREIERTGAVDLARFYARRVRRLLPASALVLLATVAFAFAFYSPLEQGQIAWTAVATASYLSNVHFARAATDYFAVAIEANPLLHTWSLAVEEQFYLVWPALVWLGLRGAPSRRRLAAVVVAVSVASFGVAVWAMQTAPTWAFFGSPLRAWEFGVGALAAVLPPVRATVRARISGPLGWTGLAAVVASAVFYSTQTPFPGATALLPVGGTVAVLLAGAWSPGRGVARALDTRALQQFGRLSYSWYLWHWPVFVFAGGLYGGGLLPVRLPLPVRLALLLLSLLLAEASYRLVEEPVRHHPWIAATPRRGLALLAALTVLCVAVSGAWGLAVGAVRRSPEQQRYIAARDDISDLVARGCFAERPDSELADCTDGPVDGPTVVLLGDSHAEHWAPAVRAAAETRGWRVVYLVKGACPPVDLSVYPACDAWMERALERVRRLRPDVVLTSSAPYERFSAEAWEGGTARVLADLSTSARRVIVVQGVPLPSSMVTACLSRGAWRRTVGFGPRPACDFDVGAGRDTIRTAFAGAQERAAARFPNAGTADFSEAICPEGQCRVEVGRLVVYRDDGHLTASFARTLAPAIARAVEQALRSDDRRAAGRAQRVPA